MEDDPDIREALADALRMAGHIVVTAATGVEALETLSEIGRPSMLFVDVRMPKMDGIELCRRLRAIPALATIPIAVLTAEPIDTVPGADFVLFKPIDLDVLMALVQRSCLQVSPHAGGRPLPEEPAARV